jgi:hypothetical protein
MTYADAQYKIEYITRGITYLLSGLDTNTGITFNYLGDQGFGLAPLHRITTRGPLQDGDSDIDFRLDPRVLQIPLLVKNDSVTAKFYNHYNIRKSLLDIFRPQNGGTLRVTQSYTYDDGLAINFINNIYNLDVRVLGGLTFDVDPVDYHVRTVVQLRADDPTWYRLEDNGAQPFLTYANANINGSQSTIVKGNWNAFPIIRLIGPITNWEIINDTTDRFISGASTVPAGVSWYFDLRYGFKTVYTGPNQTGTNVIANVGGTSNLTTWAFVPGNNVIRINGTGTTGATSATFSYFYRFTGI